MTKSCLNLYIKQRKSNSVDLIYNMYRMSFCQSFFSSPYTEQIMKKFHQNLWCFTNCVYRVQSFTLCPSLLTFTFRLTLLCYDFSLDAMCLINWFVSFSNFFTSCACSVLYWRHCKEENTSVHVKLKSIWICKMWLHILLYSSNKLLLWIKNHIFHNKTIF